MSDLITDEMVERAAKTYDADESTDEWGEDPSTEMYRDLARVALDAVRTHDEAGDGR